MLSVSVPTPPPPATVHAETYFVPPDEQWKADLRKRIEHSLHHMVENARTLRDNILSSQPSESVRERALREYEDSMSNLRKLAQEEFNREWRLEIMKRKSTLDAANSNSPELARQQQYNIRKANEERTSIAQSPGPIFRQAWLPGSRTPWPEPSGISRTFAYGSRQMSPAQFPRMAMYEHKSVLDAADSNSPELAWQQQYNIRKANEERTNIVQNPAFRTQVWPPSPRTPEPSGISRAFAHTSEHMYSRRPGQVPYRDGVNVTGPNSGFTGFHLGGSLNSDQNCSINGAPHRGIERPPTQARDRVASNIGPRERPMSASARPHDRPRPTPPSPYFPTVQPRVIPGARPPQLDDAIRFPSSANFGSRTTFRPQRSSEVMSQGIAVLRNPPAPEEGSQVPSIDDDLSDTSDDSVSQLDDRQNMRKRPSMDSVQTMKMEQAALWWEEVRQRGKEANMKEGETNRLEEGAPQADAIAKMREAVSQKEAEAKHKDEEMRKLEEVARQKEVARRIEEDYERKKQEIERKEAELKKKEAELLHEEQATRLAREDVARQAKEITPLDAEEAKREAMMRNKKEEAYRLAEKAQQFLAGAERIEADTRLAEASIKMREAVVQKKEAEVKLTEFETEKRQASVHRREEEVRLKEEEVIHREEAAREKEEKARHLEDKAQQSLETAQRLEVHTHLTEASIKIREAAVQKNEAEVNIKVLEAKRREADVHRREEEGRLKEAELGRKEEEVTRREGDARRTEEQGRQLEERAQQSLKNSQRVEVGARQAEAEAGRRESEAREVVRRLEEKEKYLQIREAEIQEMLQEAEKRREALKIQEVGLQEKLVALKESEESLCQREAALTQRMALERQGKDEAGLVSLASTTRNSDHYANTDFSSKSTSRLKENSEHYNNEG